MSPGAPGLGRGPARGRPRDASRGEELLRATQDLLVESGYDRLSLDAVAARAGASKSTLYRRWPSKADLVIAAVETFTWNAPTPDTGTLRGDLIEMAAEWFNPDSKRDRLFVRLLTALPDDERLRDFYHAHLHQPRMQTLTTIIDRAVARGEIARPETLESVAEIVPAIAFHRLVVHRTPVDSRFIDHVLDDVLLPALGRGRAPVEEAAPDDRDTRHETVSPDCH